MHDIAPAELEDIDVIKLANRDTISAVGIVRDVEVLCGKTKYPTDFLVLASPQDNFCPSMFGRPFLNTVNAKIDCKKDIVSVGLGVCLMILILLNSVDNPMIKNFLVKMKLLVFLLLSCLLMIL